MNCTGRRK